MSPQLSTFAWCDISGPDGTRPDAYCSLCPIEYTSVWGVVHTCNCPNHTKG